MPRDLEVNCSQAEKSVKETVVLMGCLDFVVITSPSLKTNVYYEILHNFKHTLHSIALYCFKYAYVRVHMLMIYDNHYL